MDEDPESSPWASCACLPFKWRLSRRAISQSAIDGTALGTVSGAESAPEECGQARREDVLEAKASREGQGDYGRDEIHDGDTRLRRLKHHPGCEDSLRSTASYVMAIGTGVPTVLPLKAGTPTVGFDSEECSSPCSDRANQLTDISQHLMTDQMGPPSPSPHFSSKASSGLALGETSRAAHLGPQRSAHYPTTSPIARKSGAPGAALVGGPLCPFLYPSLAETAAAQVVHLSTFRRANSSGVPARKPSLLGRPNLPPATTPNSAVTAASGAAALTGSVGAGGLSSCYDRGASSLMLPSGSTLQMTPGCCPGRVLGGMATATAVGVVTGGCPASATSSCTMVRSNTGGLELASAQLPSLQLLNGAAAADAMIASALGTLASGPVGAGAGLGGVEAAGRGCSAGGGANGLGGEGSVGVGAGASGLAGGAGASYTLVGGPSAPANTSLLSLGPDILSSMLSEGYGGGGMPVVGPSFVPSGELSRFQSLQGGLSMMLNADTGHISTTAVEHLRQQLLCEQLQGLGGRPIEVDNLEKVGHGSFGVVYRGVWQGAHVAIKYLVSSSTQQLQISATEALLSKLLAHPNVVQTFACKVVELTADVFHCSQAHHHHHRHHYSQPQDQLDRCNATGGTAGGFGGAVGTHGSVMGSGTGSAPRRSIPVVSSCSNSDSRGGGGSGCCVGGVCTCGCGGRRGGGSPPQGGGPCSAGAEGVSGGVFGGAGGGANPYGARGCATVSRSRWPLLGAAGSGGCVPRSPDTARGPLSLAAVTRIAAASTATGGGGLGLGRPLSSSCSTLTGGGRDIASGTVPVLVPRGTAAIALDMEPVTEAEETELRDVVGSLPRLNRDATGVAEDVPGSAAASGAGHSHRLPLLCGTAEGTCELLSDLRSQSCSAGIIGLVRASVLAAQKEAPASADAAVCVRALRAEDVAPRGEGAGRPPSPPGAVSSSAVPSGPGGSQQSFMHPHRHAQHLRLSPPIHGLARKGLDTGASGGAAATISACSPAAVAAASSPVAAANEASTLDAASASAGTPSAGCGCAGLLDPGPGCTPAAVALRMLDPTSTSASASACCMLVPTRPSAVGPGGGGGREGAGGSVGGTATLQVEGASDERLAEVADLLESFQSGDGFGAPYLGDDGAVLHLPQQLSKYRLLLGQIRAKPGDFLTQIIMEYCDRGSLQRAIDKAIFRASARWNARVALRAMLRTAREVAQGMCHLHASQIVHGDLKPANVLLKSSRSDRRGFIAKVADFGLSKIVQVAERGALECDTDATGTIAYMAPEVLRGSLCPAADIYSFGVLLWQLVTGERPFADVHPGRLYVAVCSGALRLEWPPDTHPMVRKLGDACLHLDKRQRPSFTKVARVLGVIETVVRNEGAAAAMSAAAAAAGLSAAVVGSPSGGGGAAPMQLSAMLRDGLAGAGAGARGNGGGLFKSPSVAALAGAGAGTGAGGSGGLVAMSGGMGTWPGWPAVGGGSVGSADNGGPGAGPRPTPGSVQPPLHNPLLYGLQSGTPSTPVSPAAVTSSSGGDGGVRSRSSASGLRPTTRTLAAAGAAAVTPTVAVAGPARLLVTHPSENSLHGAPLDTEGSQQASRPRCLAATAASTSTGCLGPAVTAPVDPLRAAPGYIGGLSSSGGPIGAGVGSLPLGAWGPYGAGAAAGNATVAPVAALAAAALHAGMLPGGGQPQVQMYGSVAAAGVRLYDGSHAPYGPPHVMVTGVSPLLSYQHHHHHQLVAYQQQLAYQQSRLHRELQAAGVAAAAAMHGPLLQSGGLQPRGSDGAATADPNASGGISGRSREAGPEGGADDADGDRPSAGSARPPDGSTGFNGGGDGRDGGTSTSAAPRSPTMAHAGGPLQYYPSTGAPPPGLVLLYPAMLGGQTFVHLPAASATPPSVPPVTPEAAGAANQLPAAARAAPGRPASPETVPTDSKESDADGDGGAAAGSSSVPPKRTAVAEVPPVQTASGVRATVAGAEAANGIGSLAMMQTQSALQGHMLPYHFPYPSFQPPNHPPLHLAGWPSQVSDCISPTATSPHPSPTGQPAAVGGAAAPPQPAPPPQRLLAYGPHTPQLLHLLASCPGAVVHSPGPGSQAATPAGAPPGGWPAAAGSAPPPLGAYVAPSAAPNAPAMSSPGPNTTSPLAAILGCPPGGAAGAPSDTTTASAAAAAAAAAAVAVTGPATAPAFPRGVNPQQHSAAFMQPYHLMPYMSYSGQPVSSLQQAQWLPAQSAAVAAVPPPQAQAGPSRPAAQQQQQQARVLHLDKAGSGGAACPTDATGLSFISSTYPPVHALTPGAVGADSGSMSFQDSSSTSWQPQPGAGSSMPPTGPNPGAAAASSAVTMLASVALPSDGSPLAARRFTSRPAVAAPSWGGVAASEGSYPAAALSLSAVVAPLLVRMSGSRRHQDAILEGDEEGA